MSDGSARESMVKELRTFAAEMRVKYTGADAAARAIEAVANGVEQRHRLTILVNKPPETEHADRLCALLTDDTTPPTK